MDIVQELQDLFNRVVKRMEERIETQKNVIREQEDRIKTVEDMLKESRNEIQRLEDDLQDARSSLIEKERPDEISEEYEEFVKSMLSHIQKSLHNEKIFLMDEGDRKNFSRKWQKKFRDASLQERVQMYGLRSTQQISVQ